MFQILLLLVIIVVVFVVAFLIGRYGLKNRFSLEEINRQRHEKKELAKGKILALFNNQNKITNNDVQKLLSSSHATATNYLEELQKEGKITQHGNIGHSVFYTKDLLHKGFRSEMKKF